MRYKKVFESIGDAVDCMCGRIACDEDCPLALAAPAPADGDRDTSPFELCWQWAEDNPEEAARLMGLVEDV